jgi:hypothetical protein
MSRLILAFLVLVAPVVASAFNPDPRPTPTGNDPVCADAPTTTCDPDSAADCASHTCIVAPADRFSDVAVRGTLTLVSDEDVTGWDAGTDTSTERPANARLTLLLEYEHAGARHLFAETYRLTGDCAFGSVEPGEPFLCVPAGAGWSQPASEAVITSSQLNIVFTPLLNAVGKAIAAELTGDPSTTARPFLDIVDRLPETTSDHSSASDPLASVQQLKVTIRLIP